MAPLFNSCVVLDKGPLSLTVFIYKNSAAHLKDSTQPSHHLEEALPEPLHPSQTEALLPNAFIAFIPIPKALTPLGHSSALDQHPGPICHNLPNGWWTVHVSWSASQLEPNYLHL